MTDPRIAALLSTLERLGTAGIADESLALIATAQEQVRVLADAITPLKLSGDPKLDALIRRPCSEFAAIRDSLPKTYWARYDLSAVRLGFELARRDGSVSAETAHGAIEG